MKKVIFISIIVLMIIICVFGIILKINSEIKNNTLVATDFGNIVAVKMRKGTEGGYFYYKTEDSVLIQKIYTAIKNLKIGREADINVVDDTRDYIFVLDDGTEKIFSFQSVFYHKDYKNYEVENFKDLKRIEIPEVESKNY